jgi:hypothetical protein
LCETGARNWLLVTHKNKRSSESRFCSTWLLYLISSLMTVDIWIDSRNDRVKRKRMKRTIETVVVVLLHMISVVWCITKH